LAIGIKYLAGSSLGTAFEAGETRSVVVTDESVSAISGYEGDTVTYIATVLDNTDAKLPAAFLATLKLDGTNLIVDQDFDTAMYSQATGELTLDFTVPASVGEFVVTLHWAEQVI